MKMTGKFLPIPVVDNCNQTHWCHVILSWSCLVMDYFRCCPSAFVLLQVWSSDELCCLVFCGFTFFARPSNETHRCHIEEDPSLDTGLRVRIRFRVSIRVQNRAGRSRFLVFFKNPKIWKSSKLRCLKFSRFIFSDQKTELKFFKLVWLNQQFYQGIFS